ncbi:cytochrome c oxidase subunit 3 [Hymenobacter baengnokdamensis]|uniref:cytochrome c oxidase subunit 3 n=1 Tax=Hymenobacter baengnokdamensis TaxID=2615203 RepID=UPI001E4AD433|nr:cytochrome c oxidase subunit 3 [Hymenobacter baengnokdamensis]
MQAPRDDRNIPSGTGHQRAGHSAFSRIERVPPLLMLLYLALLGITMLFVTLVAMYVASRAQSTVPRGIHAFPRYFSLSTVVLLVSSYTLAQAPRLYRADDLPGLARCLGATLLLGSIFSGLQVLGWRELVQQGVLFTGERSGTFVYVISGLHVAHILAGLLFLLAQLLKTLHASRDAVRTLVFIRNPYHLRQLRALLTYWHFIDVLWVGLFGMFLFLY